MGRQQPVMTDRFWPIPARHKRQKSADCSYSRQAAVGQRQTLAMTLGILERFSSSEPAHQVPR